MEKKEHAKVVFEAQHATVDFKINRKGFFSGQGTLRALNDVSFLLYQGESLAVVGESGSGKSTLCRVAMRFYNLTQGKMLYLGQDVHNLNKALLKNYRQKVQMVFQDPFSSLNPLHTINYHLERPYKIHQNIFKKQELTQKINETLEQVGLTPAEAQRGKFPHQLSGGQKQRAFLGKVLATGADAIFADEPTSMLDVSIRLGILNFMNEMKRTLNKSFLYITHDIAAARYFADRIIVLYSGHMMEWGNVDEIVQNPKHPYTKLLIAAAPDTDRKTNERMEIKKGAERKSWTPESKGCPFYSFCKIASSDCMTYFAEAKQISENRFVRCNKVN